MTALDTAVAALRRAPDDRGTPITISGQEAAALVVELDRLRAFGEPATESDDGGPRHATVGGVELRHRTAGSAGLCGPGDEYRSGPGNGGQGEPDSVPDDVARRWLAERDEARAEVRRLRAAPTPAIVKIDRVMEGPTAPDWGGEETDEGTPIQSMAWDSIDDDDESDTRLWVGPYSGGLDSGWAVTVDAPSVDVVLRCTADQVIEWADCVQAAILNSRRDAGRPDGGDQS